MSSFTPTLADIDINTFWHVLVRFWAKYGKCNTSSCAPPTGRRLDVMHLHDLAPQGPTPTLASILKHSDVSPRVFDDILSLPVSFITNCCDMDSLSLLDSLRPTLTRIASPSGTPHRSLPLGPSSTNPEPWAQLGQMWLQQPQNAMGMKR